MRIFLAPMESVVDHHFRSLYSAIGGIDVMVSEFIRVNDQPVTAKTLLRECPELGRAQCGASAVSATEQGIPVRVQLLGSNPSTLAESAALAAEMGAAAIDLNFGCPAKTVNNSRGGSVLLKEPALVGRIVSAVRQAVPDTLPVTAKIRLGFEARDLYMENAAAIAAAGATELCVHARSRADGYNPPAYWSCIGEIVATLSIPVVANGEIWSVADWRRCKAESGATDFMLGRGLIACPDLALQIKAAAEGRRHVVMPWTEILPMLRTLYDATKSQYPRRFLGNRLKQWLHYLQQHYADAADFFERVKRLKQQEEFDAAFTLAFAQAGSLAGPLNRPVSASTSPVIKNSAC